MANVRFMVFDDEGRITQNNSCPEEVLYLQSTGGINVIEGNFSTNSFYIKHVQDQIVDAEGDEVQPEEWEIAIRPVSPAKIDGSRLYDLPVPCVVKINDKEYPCDEDHADLEFNLPGVYNVSVLAFPLLDASFQVTK